MVTLQSVDLSIRVQFPVSTQFLSKRFKGANWWLLVFILVEFQNESYC